MVVRRGINTVWKEGRRNRRKLRQWWLGPKNASRAPIVPRGVGGKTWGHPQMPHTSIPGEPLPAQTIQSLFFDALRQRLRVVWSGYTRVLYQRPVLITSITAGFMYGLGDFTAQKVERLLGIESTGKLGFNYERFARMAVFGFVFAGPLLAVWYPMLHKMTTTYRLRYVPSFSLFGKNFFYNKHVLDGPQERFVEGAVKVMCDNLFFQPPFITLYLVVMGSMEGKSFNQMYQQTKKNFHDVWGYSFLLWIPAQSINFTFVPVPLQAFFVNMTNFFWKILMSLVYHQRDYGEKADDEETDDAVVEQLQSVITTLQANNAELQKQGLEQKRIINRQAHVVRRQEIHIEALTEQGNLDVDLQMANALVEKSPRAQGGTRR